MTSNWLLNKFQHFKPLLFHTAQTRPCNSIEKDLSDTYYNILNFPIYLLHILVQMIIKMKYLLYFYLYTCTCAEYIAGVNIFIIAINFLCLIII